jgi:hypothetical protein
MSFVASLSTTGGYHPTVKTQLNAVPPHNSCSLHLTLELPPAVFIDKYEFPLDYRYIGHEDLELPVHALANNGESWLLVNVGSGATVKGSEVEIEIPLHLRYAQPKTGGGYDVVDMNMPFVFWACPKSSMSYQPFHGVSGADTPSAATATSLHRLGPFASDFKGFTTHAIHSASSVSETSFTFNIPRGDLEHLKFVQLGTFVAVMISFLYLGITLWNASTRLSKEPSKNTERLKIS